MHAYVRRPVTCENEKVLRVDFCEEPAIGKFVDRTMTDEVLIDQILQPVAAKHFLSIVRLCDVPRS